MALDFANTVCYRAIRRAASTRSRRLLSLRPLARLRPGFRRRAYGQGARRLPAGHRRRPLQGNSRGRTDALFRPIAAGERPDTAPIAPLLRVHQELLAGERLQVGDAGLEIEEGGRPSFAVLLTQSALQAGCLARSAAAQNLPELPLALHRPLAQCQPALVRHAHLRKPRQGGTAPAAPADTTNQ